MTAAQKTAKANFKKAIEYRKKTGVSLKEAFAHVYGKKKVGAAPKKKAAKKKAAPKKAAKKVVKKSAPKKVAKKKHTKYGVVKKHVRRVAGVVKHKKIKEQSILNKIHKVKDQVNQLDELQHKHMVGSVQKDALRRIADLNSAITMKEGQYKRILRDKKMWVDAYGLASYQKNLKAYRNIIAELKKHKAELKKHI